MAELRDLEAHPGRYDLLAGFGEWLVTGRVTAVTMLAPELVVPGDPFAALPTALVDRVRDELHRRSLVSRAAGGTRVAGSPLERDGKLVGAAELAFEPALGAV
ncbi:hypothetical protein ACL02T_19890 [Pseudonocardia sp. RS010]|uniref:hypothetical protein n=1 Tax=Pseudonocardia sp. RS010 TaxID=3385979 RepID=UPI0039A2D8AA